MTNGGNFSLKFGNNVNDIKLNCKYVCSEEWSFFLETEVNFGALGDSNLLLNRRTRGVIRYSWSRRRWWWRDGGGKTYDGRCTNLRLLWCWNLGSWCDTLTGLGWGARWLGLYLAVASQKMPGSNRKDKYVHLIAHEGLDKRVIPSDGWSKIVVKGLNQSISILYHELDKLKLFSDLLDERRWLLLFCLHECDDLTKMHLTDVKLGEFNLQE